MELDQYVSRQASITSRVIRLFLSIFLPFRGVQITDYTWTSLLQGFFQVVDQARRESAVLAREWYDYQRGLEYPDDERFDVDLAPYEYDWFEEAMRPSKKSFKVIDSELGDITQAALRVAKEVENGGRRTLLYAVGSDPKRPRWARVATGAETCGFCLMLVSRGPVYYSAESAGAGVSDETALDILDDDGQAALTELMTRWHPGCDCKVVPVFNTKKDWPGKEDSEAAYRLWKKITKGESGRGMLNAFRRAIENGQVDPADLAAA